MLDEIPGDSETLFAPGAFALPNGVAVGSNGSIFVADGGTNRVHHINARGELIKSIGGLGYSRYRFREPVSVATDPSTTDVYVLDWRNERVVIYDRYLNYKSEFGQPDFRQTAGRASALKLARAFLSFAINKGSYLPSHFGDSPPSPNSTTSAGKSAGLALGVLCYWTLRSGGAWRAFSRVSKPINPMRKPNGIAFRRGSIIIAHKNGGKVVRYEPETDGRYSASSEVSAFSEHQPFGRLANICFDLRHLFVCDEQRGRIWMFDSEMRPKREFIGHDSGIGRFAPFSSCIINSRLLATCGGRNVQLFEPNTGEVVHVSANYGELHGVSYDVERSILYVADRQVGQIRRFRLI
jgi:hypothetical protein